MHKLVQNELDDQIMYIPSSVLNKAIKVMAQAFKELNTIRARDGVPYSYYGKSDVDEKYFSSVIDDLDKVVIAMTGKSAHCHPSLYRN